MTIFDKVKESRNKFLFTTPSHGGKSLFLSDFKGYYKYDTSEIDSLDNLQNPRHEILEAEEKASEIYGTKKTFYLTNGSTEGIIAILMSLIKDDDKVLVARNCHKSVFSALSLTCATIDWLMVDSDEKWGIYTKINTKLLEDTIKINHYKAFVMTSPTYDGVNSDISEIARICHQYHVYLIVDEAHGSLYNFSPLLPETAIQQGADFSVNSLHKNTGAINPAALLHVSDNTLDFNVDFIRENLNLIRTTSPSYPLLINIEQTIDYLYKKGEKEIEKLISYIKDFERTISKGGYELLNDDVTKIVIRRDMTNMSKLSEILYNGFNIEAEIEREQSLLFLTGIGTTKAKIKRLKEAINYIKMPMTEVQTPTFQPYPLVKIQPHDTRNLNYDIINKNDALLKISAETIFKTPPCSPVLYKGEAIQEWHLKFLDDEIKVVKNELQ